MASKIDFDVNRVNGLRWRDNGQSVLSGSLLSLFERLDRMFLDWADDWQCEEYRFPTFIPAAELNKIDYFKSFPHLVTFPVSLNPSEANLEKFTNGTTVDANGRLHLTEICDICDVLTPAACYHFYIALQGSQFSKPEYLTTLATCFRREKQYLALQRQWAFSMREIVCIGTSDEVQLYLKTFQAHLEEYFQASGLPVTFENATDPFFKPAQNPKFIMQKLDPVKTEMIFNGKLAIGSLNFHREHFGEAFDLTRDGKSLSSGCVAFGVERWLYAMLTTFGLDEARYPIP